MVQNLTAPRGSRKRKIQKIGDDIYLAKKESDVKQSQLEFIMQERQYAESALMKYEGKTEEKGINPLASGGIATH